jgi:hypothetical protein
MTNELILRVTYEDVTYDLIVDNEIPLRIDMSALESQELGKFFGIGSQTFSLPGLKETNRFFNYAYDVSTDTIPGFYNTLPCSVILNGETLLIGTLQLIQVITNDDGFVTYEVQVVDKVLQFEQDLSNKLIRNGNWAKYNHQFTFENITGSWSGDLLDGAVYYPIADYGRTQDDTIGSAPLMQLNQPSGSVIQGGYIGDISSPLQPKQWQPAIRVKDTLDVIFDQVGFTYTGSFTETEDFSNLYILNKPQEGLGIGSGVDVLFKAELEGTQTISSVNSTTQARSRILSMSQEIFDDSGNYDPNTYTYTTPESGDYTFNLSMNFINPATELCDVTVKLNLYSDIGGGTVQASSSIDLDYQDNEFQTLNLTYGFGYNQGVNLQAQAVLIYRAGAGSSDNLSILDSSTTFFSVTSGPVAYEGSTVDLSDQWAPLDKSLDIVKGLLQQFNLVMIPETGNKSVIRIEQFDDWIRQGEIKDWTSKYNIAKRISINHTVDELEKEILLQNAEDNDRFSKLTKESAPNYQYGTLRLLAENNISQGERKIGDYFAPIILAGAIDQQTFASGGPLLEGSYPINLNTTFVIPHLYKFENSKQESFVFKPRLGYKVQGQIPTGQSLYIESSSVAVEFTDTYHTIGNVSQLPVVSGSTNDLHFNNTYTNFTNADLNLNQGVSNFDRYWKTYLDSLYWEGNKKVTLDLYFEPYEYKQIQLNDRVLIKDQVFRINKISGFNVSYRDVVTVELIKLYPAYWQLTNDQDLPRVETSAATGITSSEITFNGEVTNDGDPVYTSKGFYWKQGTDTPTVRDNVLTTFDTGTPEYSIAQSGLASGTQYTYVAWVTNKFRTNLGAPVTVTTL